MGSAAQIDINRGVIEANPRLAEVRHIRLCGGERCESAGKWQVRGNGNLALTDHELLFAQWVPNRLVRILRKSIVEVTTARSHLGKTIFRDLLKVVWTTELGAQDSIALWGEDLDGWLEALAAE